MLPPPGGGFMYQIGELPSPCQPEDYDTSIMVEKIKDFGLY